VAKHTVISCHTSLWSRVASHKSHNRTCENACTCMFVYIGNLSLSPIVILFNHGHQHSYLSWCAPPETSKVVQNQQPQDALEFLINGPPRWAKFQQSSPPPQKKEDQCTVVLLIYQSFSMSPVRVELIPRIIRFIFPQLKNGLGLEFSALCGGRLHLKHQLILGY
jgi:hypothetical protein